MIIRFTGRVPLCAAAALALAGCAAPPEPPQSTASKLVADRTGLDLEIPGDHSPAVAAAVSSLLARPLTTDSAVRIALLNSKSLAVQLSDMGVAQADFEMAAQVPNPAFYIAVRPPDRRPPGERAVDIEASAAEDVLGILLLPLKKKIAAGMLRDAAVRSADAALRMVHDVRVAMTECQRVQQQLKLDQQYADAADAASDFARRMHDAGNITELELAQHIADAAQAKMDVLDTQTDWAERQETVNRLLGLCGAATAWTAEALPPVPRSADPDVAGALAAASRDRLDLQLSQVDIDTAERNVKLAGVTVLPHVNVGVDMERETNKQTVVGPSVGFEIPIFNQHRGEIAKAKALLRQTDLKRAAMQIDVEADLRQAADRRSIAREQAELATATWVPQRVIATAAVQRQYNGMLVGLYQLLAAKQAEITARRSAVNAVARYWIAQADWNRAIGK